MINNRPLLVGVGVGLIAGVLLLQLMSVTAPSGAAAGPKEMDRQQLKDAASQYFNVYEKDQKLYNQSQVDALLQQKLKEGENTPDLAQPSSETVVAATYIYISKGLTAGNVADLLVTSGVISDRKAFVEAMQKQQLNDKIVAGVHTFRGPQELSQVLTNITSQ